MLTKKGLKIINKRFNTNLESCFLIKLKLFCNWDYCSQERVLNTAINSCNSRVYSLNFFGANTIKVDNEYFYLIENHDFFEEFIFKTPIGVGMFSDTYNVYLNLEKKQLLLENFSIYNRKGVLVFCNHSNVGAFISIDKINKQNE